ncbi:uncharacterized protein LOC144108617 [Amblyomma americanum]
MATNAPLVSTGQAFEELEPFQVPGAAAMNESITVPDILSLEPASREALRAEEPHRLLGDASKGSIKRKALHITNDAYSALSQGMKNLRLSTDEHGALSEHLGVASEEDEPMVVEPNEETQTERPPAPEYILLEQWEAYGSGGPYLPEEPASWEEQRDKKAYHGREIAARANAALDDVMREAIEAFGETLRESPPSTSPEALPDHWEAPGSGDPNLPAEPSSREEQHDENPIDGSGTFASVYTALDEAEREASDAFGETHRESPPSTSPEALPDHWEAPRSGDQHLLEEPSSREEQHDKNQDVNNIPLHSLFLACEKCDDLFTKQYNLEMHTRRKHWHSTEGIHHCTHCTYTSTRKADIIRHERTHVGRRDSVCHLCQKRFSRPDTLKVHMIIHSAEKPYECSQCGKKFRERAHARRHEQVIHSRRYPLTCPRCGAGAEDVTRLRRHTCKPLGTTEGNEELKRGRGRPRLRADGTAPKVRPRNTTEGTPQQGGVKRGRGRTRKVIAQDASAPAP